MKGKGKWGRPGRYLHFFIAGTSFLIVRVKHVKKKVISSGYDLTLRS